MRQITCSILIALSLLAIAQSATVQPAKPFLDHYPSHNITTLQEIKSLPGFKALKANREVSSGVVRIQQIPQLLSFWFNSVSLSQDTQTKFLKEYNVTTLNSLLNPNKKDANVTFDLRHYDEEKLYNFKVMIRPHPTSKGVAQWEKVLWTASIKPFDRFMTVNRLECNAFQCTMKDKDHYVLSNITEKHVGILENLALNFLFQ